MRNLDFEGPEGESHFELIYDGLLQTPRGFKAPTETRVIGSVLSKLENIGKTETIETPSGGDFATYRLNRVYKEPITVKLEEAEFNLLIDSLKPIQWRTAGSRQATKTMEWLDKIEEYTEDAETRPKS